MAEVEIKKSRAVILISGVALFALTVPLMLLNLWDVFAWETRWQSGKYDSWWTTVFGVALFTGLGVPLWLWFIQIWTVNLTDEGVWQRRLLGWQFIAWKNVTYVESVPYAVILHHHQKKVIINLVVFSSPEAVVEFIGERISSSVFR